MKLRDIIGMLDGYGLVITDDDLLSCRLEDINIDGDTELEVSTTLEQRGAAMYRRGYRFCLTLGNMHGEVFVAEEKIEPLFVKTVSEAGPLMREHYPEYCVHGYEIDSNGVRIPNASFKR